MKVGIVGAGIAALATTVGLARLGAEDAVTLAALIGQHGDLEAALDR